MPNDTPDVPRPEVDERDVEPAPRCIARLLVDADVLVGALHLPASLRIVDAKLKPARYMGLRYMGLTQVQLELEGSAFPPVPPGAEPPDLRVILRRWEDGRVTLDKLELVPPPGKSL